MCDFFSFVVVPSADGLKYYTDPSLKSHHDAVSLHHIQAAYREVEWLDDLSITIRLTDTESESIGEQYTSAIRQDWSTRQALVNAEIIKHAQEGRLPEFMYYEDKNLAPNWKWLLLADIVARALPFFEANYPENNRPRACVEVLRQWPIDKNAAARAARAAYAAAGAAYAARAAYAAAYAAYAAAGAAYAARAARAAADAAYAAAYAAACAAGAARAAERKWQCERLLYYIQPEVKHG